jgi:regulator of protease activity HflC (stomatin/prohibitin superfamily)
VKVPLRGSVRPDKRRLVLIVQLRRRGVWQPPGYKAVVGRKGRFATFLRPGRKGAWRYSVATIADRSHGRGRTRVYPLTVGR